MDHVESDSSGSGSPLSMCAEGASAEYALSYLESFLPVFQMVNQSPISSVADRYKAIRFAADASLALTASGKSWSAALEKELAGACDEGVHSNGLLCEDRLSRGLKTEVASRAFTTVNYETPECEREDACCEPNARVESDGWMSKVGGSTPVHRRGLTASKNISIGLRFIDGRRNWSQHQRFSRDTSRLAILRKLSLRNKSKRRLLRNSWKPRATVRKAKSLAWIRRRLARSSRVVDVAEPERTFENGIVALQRLVPGGSSMDAAVLLDEASDFVMFLQLQVQALQSVANAVDERLGEVVREAGDCCSSMKETLNQVESV